MVYESADQGSKKNLKKKKKLFWNFKNGVSDPFESLLYFFFLKKKKIVFLNLKNGVSDPFESLIFIFFRPSDPFESLIFNFFFPDLPTHIFEEKIRKP